jgi:hypothetical protein
MRQRKTHRKKRINKKWRKRYGFEVIRTPSKEVIHITIPGKECFIMHPTVFEEFKRQVDAAQEKALDHAMNQVNDLIYGRSRPEKDWRNSSFQMETLMDAYGQIIKKDFA